MAHSMLQEKRATRGKRMSALVGKAAEEDEVFYNNELWQEGDESENESYSEESEKPDVFDSDFDESEDSEDDEEGGGSSEEEQETSNKKNKYKEPETKKRKSVQRKISTSLEPLSEGRIEIDGETSTEVKPKMRRVKATDTLNDSSAEPRKVRESTKAKTSENIEKLKLERILKLKVKRDPKPKVTFDQMELLKEALQTEEESYRWLQRKKFNTQNAEAAQAELIESQKPKRKPLQDFVRFYSHKKAGNYLTFSSNNVLPDFVKGTLTSPEIPNKTCVITGLPAKYRDPKTMLPYASLEAYKELQRKLANGEIQVPVETKKTPRLSSKKSISGAFSFPNSSRNCESGSEDGHAMVIAENEGSYSRQRIGK